VNLRILLCVLLAAGWAVARAAEPAPSPPLAGMAPRSVALSSDLVHVAGSDMLQTAIGEPLTRYAQDARLKVKVDLQGSMPALSGLKAGKIQLAILTAPLGQPPAPKEFKVIPLCFAVDYIIVNQANPLNVLDLRQLSSVFGLSEQGGMTWGTLQVGADWAARPIVPCSTSTDDGLVIEIFKNEILGGNALKPTVRILNTAREMVKTIVDNPNAIGLGGYDPGAPCKVVQISTTSSAASAAVSSGSAKGAAHPTPEAVFSGDYPLRLPFYLVYKAADKASVLPLLRLLLSDEYAARLQAEHFVPVPDTERNRARLELDNPD